MVKRKGKKGRRGEGYCTWHGGRRRKETKTKIEKKQKRLEIIKIQFVLRGSSLRHHRHRHPLSVLIRAKQKKQMIDVTAPW